MICPICKDTIEQNEFVICDIFQCDSEKPSHFNFCQYADGSILGTLILYPFLIEFDQFKTDISSLEDSKVLISLNYNIVDLDKIDQLKIKLEKYRVFLSMTPP